MLLTMMIIRLQLFIFDIKIGLPRVFTRADFFYMIALTWLNLHGFFDLTWGFGVIHYYLCVWVVNWLDNRLMKRSFEAFRCIASWIRFLFSPDTFSLHRQNLVLLLDFRLSYTSIASFADPAWEILPHLSFYRSLQRIIPILPRLYNLTMQLLYKRIIFFRFGIIGCMYRMCRRFISPEISLVGEVGRHKSILLVVSKERSVGE